MSIKKVGSQYDALSIKISDAIPVIKMSLEAGLNPMLWGSYGVGKTSIVGEIGKEMGFDEVIILHPSQDDIIDYKLPYLQDDEDSGEKVSAFALSSRLPRKGRCLVFVDEINTASMSLQPTLYSLILEGSIGSYKMPKECRRMAAGNRESDKCAANPMAAALKDRMCPHLNIVPDAESWCKWAFTKNIRPEIIAFVRELPHVLEQADPSDPSGGCTPRSLERLSRLLNAGIPQKSEQVVIRGTIGQAMGAEFDGYLNLFRGKIDMQEIINNPSKAPLPNRGDMRYAICSALSYHLGGLKDPKKKEQTKIFDNILTYLSRMDKTYKIVVMTDAIRVNPNLADHDLFKTFCLENVHLIVE